MRTFTPRSRSTAASRGRMKVVSDRFISLATACISASLRPRASGKTARGLPSRGLAEKTSIVTMEKRRGGLLMRGAPNSGWHMDAGRARIDTTFPPQEEAGGQRALLELSHAGSVENARAAPHSAALLLI